MAAPFGFSAGDFIAGLHLLNKAVAALCDTDGASSDYQSTATELDSIVTVLRKVQGFQATDATSDIVEKIHFFAHLCHLPLEKFLAKLRTLEPELGISATLNNTNANVTAHGLVKKYGKRPARQVQWAVQLKKHVIELRASVGPQLDAISILLLLISCERQAILHNDHVEFVQHVQTLQDLVQTHNDNLTTSLTNMGVTISADVTNRVSQDLRIRLDVLDKEIKSRLERLQVTNSIRDQTAPSQVVSTQIVLQRHQGPQSPVQDNRIVPGAKRGLITKETTVGEIIELLQDAIHMLFLRFCILLSLMRTMMQYTAFIARMPTALLSDNIRFEDALGRIVSLQYEHFRHLPVFMARLQFDFRNAPGKERIELNQFSFADARTGKRLLTEEDWSTHIRPRSSIVMSMVFEKVRFSEIWYFEQSCPRCRAGRVSKRRHKDTWQCTVCGFTYHMREQIGSSLWRARQSTSILSSPPPNPLSISAVPTPSPVNVPQDSIRMYKHVRVAKTCTNPDCFSQNPTSWAKDADGHDVCDSCPYPQTRGEETEKDNWGPPSPTSPYLSADDSEEEQRSFQFLPRSRERHNSFIPPILRKRLYDQYPDDELEWKLKDRMWNTDQPSLSLRQPRTRRHSNPGIGEHASVRSQSDQEFFS